MRWCAKKKKHDYIFVYKYNLFTGGSNSHIDLMCTCSKIREILNHCPIKGGNLKYRTEYI